MNLKNTFIIAIKAIMTNKIRSFLTMLGIIIGVGSVVMLIAIGQGLEKYISNELESFGPNIIAVEPGASYREGSGSFSAEGSITAALQSKLRLKHVEEIKKLTDLVDEVMPNAVQSGEVSWSGKNKKVMIVGHPYGFSETFSINVDQGRSYTKSEDLKAEKVVIIGSEVAEEFFAQANPIGKKIKVNNKSFKVVGVFEKRGGLAGASIDSSIYMPIRAFNNLFDSDLIMEINIVVQDSDKVPMAMRKVEEVMLKYLEEDDFSIISFDEMMKTVDDILGMVTIGVGGIAAISLLVGGIGIMNIMLVSVTERTKEIGLRKAIGATPAQVLAQFLIESSVLSILGGMIGLGIAALGAAAIKPYFPATITYGAVSLAFGVSTFVGVVFGVAPARKASKLSPVEALLRE